MLSGGLTGALAGCRSLGGVQRGERLTPADGESGDAFGWDVALSEAWALVGAPAADGGTGAAYLFDIEGNTQQRLEPEDTGGEFGGAVAVAGNRALVGAPATGETGGAVAVYERSDGEWTRETRLTPPDESSEEFGYDVSLSGSSAVVGARGTDRAGATDAGAACVYEDTADGWTHRATLAPGDAAAYDYAGGSVALGEDRALLGSFLADGPATDAGSASVFERADGAWAEQATLTAPDAAAGDRFGNAVALDAGRALVGAVGRGGGPDAAADSGGAYVFQRGGGEWAHETTLTAPTEDPDAGFGVAVALADEQALVGAFSANGTGPGRAMLFERNGEWGQRTTLRPADGAAGDGFGSSVALADDRALVGSVGDGPGSATLFSL
jgi:hypothetical protein